MIQSYSVRVTTLGSRTRALTVQLVGAGAEGADDSAGPTADPNAAPPEVVPSAEVLQPLGLFARPAITARTEAIGIELGDEVLVLCLVDKSGGGGSLGSFAGGHTVAEGETVLYGAREGSATVRIGPQGDVAVACAADRTLTLTHPSGASITIETDGSITVNAASGKDIAFNGGTKRVAREEDALNVGVLSGTAGPYPVVFAYVPGMAGVAPPTPPGAVHLAGVIQTGTGADHTKG